VDRTARARLRDHIVDIRCRDPRVRESRGVDESVLMLGEEFDAVMNIGCIAIEQVSPPAVIDDEVRGITLLAVTGTDLHAGPIDWRYQGKQIQEQAVLLELRVFAEADILHTG